MSQAIVLKAGNYKQSFASPDFVKTIERWMMVLINVTVVPGVDTITPRIEAKDMEGNYYTLVQGADIVATGKVKLQLGPGLPDTANLSANAPVPTQYRISMIHSGAGQFTYSIDLDAGQ